MIFLTQFDVKRKRIMDFGVRSNEEQTVFRERERSGWPKEWKKMNSYIAPEFGLPDVTNRLTG